MLGDDMPLVRGDGIQLQQVILNLLVNGAQAMWRNRPDQDRLLRIRTRLLPEGDRVAVSVSDHGPGVEGPLEKLFEPFFSTKKEGLGMGLSINRTLIEAHGGRLSASRNDERGLTFTFSLPVAGPGGADI
jgi:two-component system sensor kinase FixL